MRVEYRKIISPRLPGADMRSAVNGEEEFVDVDADVMPPSPPMKRMRGSLAGKVAPGKISGGVLNPTPVEEVDARWAMVLYDPRAVSARSNPAHANGANGKASPLEPFAVRDNPPGMRIRGARQMPPVKQGPPKPVEKMKKKLGKRKVSFDPAVITVLSDSEPEDNKQAGPSRQSAKPVMKKAGVVPMKLKKKTAHGKDEPRVKFDPAVDELKPEADPRTRVKYILNQFDNLRRLFLAEEEERVKDVGGAKRPDLKAYHALSKSRSRVNGFESIYGEVPGVQVGDHYFYRMELLLVSLHKQPQGGIDYIPESRSQFRDDKGRPISVAVSVIASGGYEDDRDEGDTLTYTGQGGNNYIGNKRQGQDQDLKRGNLALKNCKELGLAVRVIRGCDYKKSPLNQGSPSGRIYYYDGMYDVVDCYQERGSAGFQVWKYKLVRKHGQKPLSSSLVIFKGKALPPVLQERGERIIAEDLSNGLEPFKVRVVGCLDEDREPKNFEYIHRLRYSPGLPKPLPPTTCTCFRDCFGRSGCQCIALNGGDQPYNDEGGLLRAKRLVYECGPTCRCAAASKCINRVAQNGLRYELEVFKTKGKGWGVRSSYFIPQGSFVCEYIGEIIHETDAEKRVSDDEYMFDLKIPDSMERRFGQISGLKISSSSDEDDDDVNCQKYTVDANRCGNLARFINHSCDPNLFVQCVLYDHHDDRFPHIMLFASEHISPYKELTYDYGYELGTVMGKDGKIKKKNCYCGARICRGRLY